MKYLIILIFNLVFIGSLHAKDFIGFNYGMSSLAINSIHEQGGESFALNYTHIFNEFIILKTQFSYTSIPLHYVLITEENNRVPVYQLKISNITTFSEPRLGGIYAQYGINFLHFSRKSKESERWSVSSNSGLNFGIQLGFGYLINLTPKGYYNVMLDLSLDYSMQFIGKLDNKSRLYGHSFYIVGVQIPLFTPSK